MGTDPSGRESLPAYKNLPSHGDFAPDSGHVTFDTCDTLPLMAACNIRNVDASLLRRMKAKAAEEGVTLRDWALAAFAEKLERRTESLGSAREDVRGPKRDVEKAPTAGIEPAAMPSSSVAADQSPRADKSPEAAKCNRCDGVVYRDPTNSKYWRCFVCRRQLDDHEVKAG